MKIIHATLDCVNTESVISPVKLIKTAQCCNLGQILVQKRYCKFMRLFRHDINNVRFRLRGPTLQGVGIIRKIGTQKFLRIFPTPYVSESRIFENLDVEQIRLFDSQLVTLAEVQRYFNPSAENRSISSIFLLSVQKCTDMQNSGLNFNLIKLTLFILQKISHYHLALETWRNFCLQNDLSRKLMLAKLITVQAKTAWD